MIEVKYFNKNGRYGISVTGHAGYAPAGQDIVCASISTLLVGLGNYLTEHENSHDWKVLEVRLEEADSNVEVIIDDPKYILYTDNEILDNLFTMVIEQMKDISELYPLNVQILES